MFVSIKILGRLCVQIHNTRLRSADITLTSEEDINLRRQPINKL